MTPAPAAEREQILRLLRRFRRDRRDVTIARAARAVLDGATEIDRADAQTLVREIQAPSAARWRQSAVSTWVFGQIPVGPRTQAGLQPALCRFADREQLDNRPDAVLDVHFKLSILSGIVGCLLGLAATVQLARLGYMSGHPFVVLIGRAVFSLVAGILTIVGVLMLCWPFTTPVISAYYRWRAALPRRYAIRVLGKWKCPQGVGPVAREIQRGTPAFVEAIESLRSILAGLTPAHYGVVSARDQRSLATLLREPYLPAGLLLDVLTALGIIGGGAVLHEVRTAADSHGDIDVRSAARLVLPLIAARAQREKDSARLVRPSTDPANQEGTLVRPFERSPGENRQLVRPSDP